MGNPGYTRSLKLISSTAGKHALYDLTNDHDERHNLYNEYSSAIGLSEKLKN